MKKLPKPEWSFVIQVADVGSATTHYKLSADGDARADLAERFALLAIDSLQAHVVVARERGGAVIHVSGTLEGQATQRCVISLEAVPVTVQDTFDAYFAEGRDVISFAKARADRAAKVHGADVELEMIDEDEAPEPIVGGVIDLGEVVAQFFSLALPSYPRKAGVMSPYLTDEDEVAAGGDGDEGSGRPNPFAALKDWKDGLK